MSMEEYLRRNLLVAKAEGIKANTRYALNRLGDLKKPPKWLVEVLEGIYDRAEPIPTDLARWRDEQRRNDKRGE